MRVTPVIFDDPHPKLEVAELICLNCFHRWIGVYQTKKQLKDIVCSECDVGGCVIKTGQTLPNTICYDKEDQNESNA